MLMILKKEIREWDREIICKLTNSRDQVKNLDKEEVQVVILIQMIMKGESKVIIIIRIEGIGLMEMVRMMTMMMQTRISLDQDLTILWSKVEKLADNSKGISRMIDICIYIEIES